MPKVENREKFIKNLRKTQKNSQKTLPRLLKWLKKIDKVDQYDDYVLDFIKIPLIDWFIEVLLIRPFVIYLFLMCLSVTSILNHPPHVLIALAEGLSILWYLLVELKQDLWRN